MPNLHHAFSRLATDPLRGRVRRDELRMFAFQFLELLDQLVEIEVADFRIIEDKIAVFVVPDLFPQIFDRLFDVLTRACHVQKIIFVAHERPSSARQDGRGRPSPRSFVASPTAVVMNFVLATRRLVLREFVPADADALARVICDPETMRYYPAPYDRAGVDDWIARNLRRYQQDGHGLWAIDLKSSGDMIGDC